MAHNSGDLPHEDPPGSNMWFWADGTPVTPEEAAELKSQASGNAPSPGTSIDTAAKGVGPLDYLLPKQISASAPGSSLDTTQAQTERDRLQGIMDSLQQRAATGGGAWEKTLADATQHAQATASALGQAQANTGGDYQSGLMNIGNAQSGAAQRAVGQGNVLRAQSQQDAQDQLGDLLGGMGAQDVNQATQSGAANQAFREANASLKSKGRNAITNAVGGVGQALLSDGGPVPGQPAVFGDDQRNDTVPAMLSPGEIVVPRSKAGDPEAAAAFARAVAQRNGAQGLADGGAADVRDIPLSELFDVTKDTEDASIANGGLLDTANFDSTRVASRSLEDGLAARAAGAGASIAPQMLTNAQDDTIAGAMQNLQHAGALSAAVNAQQQAGGQAAAQAGNEQSAGTRAATHFGIGARERELAMARGQQQAGWNNTMTNAGVTLQDQALIGRMISGAAQGAGALSGAMGVGDDRSNDDPYSLDSTDTVDTGYLGDGAGPRQQSDAGDFPTDDGDTQYAAHGGVIMEDDERERAHRFLKQLRRAA